MAKTRMQHGVVMEAATPAEVEALLASARARDALIRIRASAAVVLDATGAGRDDVYGVPVGFDFEVRRVVLDLDSAADPATGNVPLNVAGRAVEYLRGDTRIEYGAPSSPQGAPAQVPGVQTWGAEQGPYLRNGEVFAVRARGLTASARLSVSVEGILRKPPPTAD